MKDNIINLDNKKQTKEKNNLGEIFKTLQSVVDLRKTNIETLKYMFVAALGRKTTVIEEKEIKKMYTETVGDIMPNYIECTKDGKMRVVSNIAADYILKTNDFIKLENGKLYVYNNNVYEATDIDVISTEIKTTVFDNNNMQYSSSRAYRNIAEIVNDDLNKNLIKGQPFPEHDYINFPSGLYEVETGKMLPHTKDIFTRYQITHDPDRNYKNSRFYKEMVCKMFKEKELLQLFQECTGLILSPHNKETKKAYWWYGATADNGKTTLLRILESVYGDNYNTIHGAIDFTDLQDSHRFESITDKLVAAMGDNGDKGIVSGLYKQLTDGSEFYINPKGKKGYTGCNNGVCIALVNRLPTMENMGNDYFTRMVVIPFLYNFGTEKEVADKKKTYVRDTGLADYIIKNEMQYVIGFMLEGLERLRINNWQHTVSNLSEQAKKDYKQERNLYQRYISERLLVTDELAENNIGLTATEILEDFKDYVIQEESYKDYNKKYSNKSITKSKLEQLLETQIIKKATRLKNYNKVVKNCIKGVTWTEKRTIIDAFSPTGETIEVCNQYREKIESVLGHDLYNADIDNIDNAAEQEEDTEQITIYDVNADYNTEEEIQENIRRMLNPEY